jgi:hypothetical protein
VRNARQRAQVPTAAVADVPDDLEADLSELDVD